MYEPVVDFLTSLLLFVGAYFWNEVERLSEAQKDILSTRVGAVYEMLHRGVVLVVLLSAMWLLLSAFISKLHHLWATIAILCANTFLMAVPSVLMRLRFA